MGRYSVSPCGSGRDHRGKPDPPPDSDRSSRGEHDRLARDGRTSRGVLLDSRRLPRGRCVSLGPIRWTLPAAALITLWIAAATLRGTPPFDRVRSGLSLRPGIRLRGAWTPPPDGAPAIPESSASSPPPVVVPEPVRATFVVGPRTAGGGLCANASAPAMEHQFADPFAYFNAPDPAAGTARPPGTGTVAAFLAAEQAQVDHRLAVRRDAVRAIAQAIADAEATLLQTRRTPSHARIGTTAPADDDDDDDDGGAGIVTPAGWRYYWAAERAPGSRGSWWRVPAGALAPPPPSAPMLVVNLTELAGPVCLAPPPPEEDREGPACTTTGITFFVPHPQRPDWAAVGLDVSGNEAADAVVLSEGGRRLWTQPPAWKPGAAPAAGLRLDGVYGSGPLAVLWDPAAAAPALLYTKVDPTWRVPWRIMRWTAPRSTAAAPRAPTSAGHGRQDAGDGPQNADEGTSDVVQLDVSPSPQFVALAPRRSADGRRVLWTIQGQQAAAARALIDGTVVAVSPPLRHADGNAAVADWVDHSATHWYVRTNARHPGFAVLQIPLECDSAAVLARWRRSGRDRDVRVLVRPEDPTDLVEYVHIMARYLVVWRRRGGARRLEWIATPDGGDQRRGDDGGGRPAAQHLAWPAGVPYTVAPTPFGEATATDGDLDTGPPAGLFMDNALYHGDRFRFSNASLWDPWRGYSLDLTTGHVTLEAATGAAASGPHQMGTSQTTRCQTRLTAPFLTEGGVPDGIPDGVKGIPMSLAWTTTDADGCLGPPHLTPRPALVLAYGAYASQTTLAPVPAHMPLLDAGFLIAYCHARGDADLGPAWYADGARAAKANTLRDVVACLRALVDSGWAQPRHVAVKLRSAGGLLAAGLVAGPPWPPYASPTGPLGSAAPSGNRMAGHLANGAVAAIVAQVPFVDPLWDVSRAHVAWTPYEWAEWGNIVCDVDVRRAMMAWSPYRALLRRAGLPPDLLAGDGDPTSEHYAADAAHPAADTQPATDTAESRQERPAVWISAGKADARVPWQEPAKWAALLRWQTAQDCTVVSAALPLSQPASLPPCRHDRLIFQLGERGHFGAADPHAYRRETAAWVDWILQHAAANVTTTLDP
ncbi:hypothetical protein CXG81DRAFT_21066 [Caulochytrium protostelioides]|uniref:Prolyl endopeptidase-like n=1 Tax=Caulochytrium protostelioides TaxID=1555241 RepID=A0A4P9X1H2_9FUNG|nr:hypothetical protein CXG81DRAFT_21066 [Caulochytrium protostelioides]|eukprot:RKO98763.1 hypothetical protein CXG81DRAFT_21066 [Caulochytrium protostelioides]